MKILIIPLCIAFLLSPLRSAIAGSMETWICIHNYTSVPHTINVADIENYDWGSSNRPDHNFNNITINPNSKVCQREDVNTYAKHQAFTFIVDDTPTRVIRNPILKEYSNCPDYVDKNSCEYSLLDNRWGIIKSENPLTLHGYNTVYFQSPSWWYGYGCPAGTSNLCSEFEIKYY